MCIKQEITIYYNLNYLSSGKVSSLASRESVLPPGDICKSNVALSNESVCIVVNIVEDLCSLSSIVSGLGAGNK